MKIWRNINHHNSCYHSNELSARRTYRCGIPDGQAQCHNYRVCKVCIVHRPQTNLGPEIETTFTVRNKGEGNVTIQVNKNKFLNFTCNNYYLLSCVHSFKLFIVQLCFLSFIVFCYKYELWKLWLVISLWTILYDLPKMCKICVY